MELALAFPYSLGLVAAFNPCGFAMLPAYLSYFLGLEGDDGDTNLFKNVLRGLVVGLTLTVGFIAVFGIFGILFETIVSRGTVLDRIGYVTITVGVMMIPLGISMLLGREFNLRLPKMNKGTDGRGLMSVFMFGVSYAVVSLSCTIGLFLAGVGSTFTDDGFADGVATFVAYGVGMGSVITFLTLSLAMARTNIAREMRRVLPYVTRISGLMLIAAGAYLINYGIFELQQRNDPTVSNSAVDWFNELQANVTNWIVDTTPERIGVICGFGVLGALLLGWREIERDAVKRRSITLTYGICYLIVEFGFNGGDFIVLPVLRFIAGWPERMGNWFTDALRAGVVGEILFSAFITWLAWKRVRRLMPPPGGAVAAPA